jgi:nuclear GTP-binding protein
LFIQYLFLGGDALLQLLKHYARTGTVRTSITVGLIGFPNVGKSSVINSLCRVRAASVGATPGVTKTSQEIHLDKRVKLLDTPGIVFPKAGDVSDGMVLFFSIYYLFY